MNFINEEEAYMLGYHNTGVPFVVVTISTSYELLLFSYFFITGKCYHGICTTDAGCICLPGFSGVSCDAQYCSDKFSR